MEYLLSPCFTIEKTKKFFTIQKSHVNPITQSILVQLNCAYSLEILRNAITRRHKWCTISTDVNYCSMQFADFENIEWEHVMNGKQSSSSYLVRKGLSRKAQLAFQIKKFLSKNSGSVLAIAVPFTIILETWNATDELKLDFGGGLHATFESTAVMQTSFRQRLDWCLDDARELVEAPARSSWHWILKPSVTNKGIGITVARDWDDVLTHLEESRDVREWVLQKYIANPLLLGGHKFHLRVYVLCVGALRVFVFDRVLMLLAAHAYDAEDLTDIYRHLTNTARAACTTGFKEELFVKVLDDFPGILMTERPDIAPDYHAAVNIKKSILRDVHHITNQLFSAFENEYTVFSPMSNCFELFGLDFLVDECLGVHLLEVNPGPDFQQTGGRLRNVIVELFEQTCSVVIDHNTMARDPAQLLYDKPAGACEQRRLSEESSSATDECGGGDEKTRRVEAEAEAEAAMHRSLRDFSLVYSRPWSASSFQGGMTFTS